MENVKHAKEMLVPAMKVILVDQLSIELAQLKSWELNLFYTYIRPVGILNVHGNIFEKILPYMSSVLGGIFSSH